MANDIDPLDKYWVIQREANYYAAWESDGLQASRNFLSRDWCISEYYALREGQPPGPDNCAESYRWATTLTLRDAHTIAHAFAAKHGGTVCEVGDVAKGAADPTKYDPADWP